VNLIVALLAHKNMIQQPKKQSTGAKDFSVFVTSKISKLNIHKKLAILLINVVEICDNILSVTLAVWNHEE
jgi:hypothetical protein